MKMHTFAVMRRTFHRNCTRHIAGAALILLLPVAAWAQETDEIAPWTQVRIIDVKRHHLAEWQDLVKELAAASAEAGLPPFAVFEEVRGTMNRFHVVQSLPALGELDEPPQPPMEAAEMAAWENRIADAEDSHRILIAQNFPDYSVQTGDAEEPELIVLRVVRTAPGHAADYEAWIAEDLVPALREANVAHMLSRGFLGDDINTWYHTLPVADWAEFDAPNPLMEAMGEEGFMKLVEGVDAMVAHHKALLLRLRPDLSSPSE